MEKEISIRIAGEAGQGVETLGLILCKIAKRAGFHFFAHLDYMSRIRGGNNFVQLRIAEQPVGSFRDRIDILIALNPESVLLHKASVEQTGLIVLDGKDEKKDKTDERLFPVPLKEMAVEKGGSALFINTAAFGSTAALLGFQFEHVAEILREAFAGKGEDVLEKNISVARAGFDFADIGSPRFYKYLKPQALAHQFFLNGNEAVALGAIAAGVQFYSAYPMSPSTGIMEGIAHYAKRFNIVVEQAEDEIAAINMAIGASAAGARAMTGTSGGGFALMCEGLSLAGMTETPLVIALAQRPGPATGFPTRTEQGELDFAIHAGHGEFARVVFSPGSVAEAYVTTLNAFSLAEKYQIPVIILTDQCLADSLVNTPSFETGKVTPVEAVITKEAGEKITNYKRYAMTENGISPRAIFSWIKDVIYLDSDEHTEEGHITESAGIRRSMVEKRFFKRMKLLEQQVLEPVYYGSKNAKKVFIGFGSTYNVMKDVGAALVSRKIGFIHLPQVWPLPKKSLLQFLKQTDEIFTVENNAGAQLAGLLRRELGITFRDSILKYDGRPFSFDEIRAEIEKRL
jgi:2-oxoglutarate ferredoxin oxidoreductase subunit alpha